jgi:hypothetical protein
VAPDGAFIAVEDEGELVRGRIVLDAQGRLAGVTGVTKAQLGNPEGGTVSGGKADTDSEGLALWPNGDLMISFEGRHRIWLYPAPKGSEMGGGRPHAVPFPDAPFPVNDGMEALAIDPQSGPTAYLVGREDTRETWICRLAEACVPYLTAGKAEYGKLVAAARPAGRALGVPVPRLQRAGRITSRLAITDRKGAELDLLTIARPANVDNTEGVAPVVPARRVDPLLPDLRRQLRQQPAHAAAGLRLAAAKPPRSDRDEGRHQPAHRRRRRARVRLHARTRAPGRGRGRS